MVFHVSTLRCSRITSPSLLAVDPVVHPPVPAARRDVQVQPAAVAVLVPVGVAAPLGAVLYEGVVQWHRTGLVGIGVGIRFAGEGICPLDTNRDTNKVLVCRGA